LNIFEVPYFKQEEKDTCGVACARILLAYNGFEISEEKLRKEVFLHKFGAWYSDLAKLFISRGMKTRVSTINVNMYSHTWADRSETELRGLLVSRSSELLGLLKTEVEKAIEYIDLGGLLEVRIPSPEMIETLIKTQPIMIPVLKSLLSKSRFDEAGHYIVLTGFDGEKYSVLDPSTGKYEINKETLYYAWLGNNRDSDGYLMEIMK